MAFTEDDVGLSNQAVVWQRADMIKVARWKCGFCDESVASKQGYVATPEGGDQNLAFIRICPLCNAPTLFTRSGQHFPISRPGNAVEHVPPDLYKLYNEARAATAAGAFTAAVMACRKMLMNIAHDKDATGEELQSFQKSVNYLVTNHYVPPGGEGWVDYIRRRGNEANHEIALMEQKDAAALIKFVEALLRLNYELPGMVPLDDDAQDEAPVEWPGQEE